MTKIPEAAYNKSFSYDGKTVDPVEFVKRIDTALSVHRTAYPKSVVYEIPATRYEHTFEYNGHTYTHIAEHSGYDMSDKLLCDGVPNAKAWKRVLDQVTKANPDLFPHQFRPIPGLDYAENDGGQGPISTVEHDLDYLSDALHEFATLRGFPENTPVDDRQLIHSFANEAIRTMTGYAWKCVNQWSPGRAVINTRGDLCFFPDICQDTRGNEFSEAAHIFFSSAKDGMRMFAEQVHEVYERAVENGDVVPNNDLER